MAPPGFADMLAAANFVPAEALMASAPPPQEPASTQPSRPNVEFLTSPDGTVETGNKLRPEDITPQDKIKNDQFSKNAGYGESLPVYVDIADTSSIPKKEIVSDAKSNPAILENEAAYQWTAAYADLNKKDSNQEFEKQVENGQYKPLTKDDVSEKSLQDLQGISKKLGNTGDKAPEFYLRTGDKSTSPDGEAFTTREGKPIVVINQAEADELKKGGENAKVAEAVVWHEESHIALNQFTGQALADKHNIPGFEKQMEKEADLLAAGSSGSNDARSAIKSLENARTNAYAEFKYQNPNGSEEDFNKAYSSPDHPTFAERKAYLENLMKSQVPDKNIVSPDPSKNVSPQHTPDVSVPQSQSMTH